MSGIGSLAVGPRSGSAIALRNGGNWVESRRSLLTRVDRARRPAIFKTHFRLAPPIHDRTAVGRQLQAGSIASETGHWSTYLQQRRIRNRCQVHVRWINEAL